MLEDAILKIRTEVTVVIGVDANVVVGSRLDHDDTSIVGKYCLGIRSSRGRRFSDWAHTHELSILNTMFQKPFGRQWTHKRKSGGALSQFSFILVDAKLHAYIIDSYAMDELCERTDHRAVCGIPSSDTGL